MLELRMDIWIIDQLRPDIKSGGERNQMSGDDDQENDSVERKDEVVSYAGAVFRRHCGDSVG